MKLKPIVLVVMVVVLAIVGTLLFMQKGDNDQKGRIGGDFTLNGVNGPVSLSDFNDQLKIVFFGYTHCPDVCPLTMANVKVALKQLPEQERKQVQTIFISVDPERDTLDHLNEYVHFFDADFVGLTGSKEQIDQVVRQYGAFYRIDKSDDDKNYSVSHSARVYLIGKDNQVKQYLYHDSSSEEIAKAVEKQLGNA